MDDQDDLGQDYRPAETLMDRFQIDGSRILWGRVVVLLVALQLAFILGRCTSPRVPKGEFNRVNQQLTQANSEIKTLKAKPSPSASPSPSPSASASSSPGASPSPSGSAQVTAYTVKPGDTLRGISIKVYGTPLLANKIGEANNVQAGALKVGSVLNIPPKSG